MEQAETDPGKQYMRHAVGKILSVSGNVGGAEKSSSNVEYGAAVAFNATALNFLTNMLKIFKGDVVLLKMIQELRSCSNNTGKGMLAGAMKPGTKTVNVPALLFAREVDNTVTLQSGETKTIYDLIIDKDERLLEGKCGVQFLDMLDLKKKYATLNEQNKTYVWTTLNKLVMSASMVVMIEHDSMDAVDDLICKVVKKGKYIAKSSGGRMDIKAASQLIASDKEVRKASKGVLKSAMNGDESAKLSCEDVGQFISHTTGKTVDVNGLADADGMIDVSDSGIERMMKIMATQGKGCVRQGNAREAQIRDRLRKKIEQRKKINE